MVSRIYFRLRTVSGLKSRVPWGREGLLLLMGLGVFGDDFVCGFIDHGIDFMIAGFGAIPGIGNVFVFAGVDFIHEQVDFFGIPEGTEGYGRGGARDDAQTKSMLAGDAADVVDHVACEGVDLIKALKISGCELAGSLVADVEAVMASDFLRQAMRGFADVVAVGTGGVYFPVQACGPGFLPKDALGEGAAADIAQANH